MNQYSREWLIKKYQQKDKIKYLFFWGHQPSKDGSVTQSCFSQWWMAPFEENEWRYPSAEHWMMIKKAELFNDDEIATRIKNAKSPAEAKKLGRLVKNFNPAKWDDAKYEIVVNGNLLKFQQNKDLKTFLLQTSERVLVEASPVDPVWGIGLAADNIKAENPLLWKGENLLGFALMEVRDRLNKEI